LKEFSQLTTKVEEWLGKNCNTPMLGATLFSVSDGTCSVSMHGLNIDRQTIDETYSSALSAKFRHYDSVAFPRGIDRFGSGQTERLPSLTASELRRQNTHPDQVNAVNPPVSPAAVRSNLYFAR